MKVTGGQIGEALLRMDCVPHFDAGEVVLLFLVRQDDRYLVYGIYYFGAGRVSKSPDDVAKQVAGLVFENREVRNLRTR